MLGVTHANCGKDEQKDTARLDTYLSAMTVGICLLSIALALRAVWSDRTWRLHRIALIVFFVMLLWEAATATTALTLLPAIGACVWFYAKGLVQPETPLTRRDALHLVPIGVIYACYLPFVLLPEVLRTGVTAQQPDMTDPKVVVVIVLMLIGWLTWIAMLAGYGIATLRLLMQSRGLVRQLYSDLEGRSLLWLHTLIVLVFGFVGATLIGSLLPVTAYDITSNTMTLPVFQFLLVFGVALFGLSQESVIPHWNELAAPAPSDAKYERSGLKASDMARIAAKLNHQMSQNQLWQNPDLSLKDLAAATGVPQNSISQTLNAHVGVNFFDYVNHWRIKAACEALLTTDATVLTIAEDTGFNAKSTFNSAFKKLTGTTPRQFRQQADRNAVPVMQ
jgi:AraC-like DNA-binding protein